MNEDGLIRNGEAFVLSDECEGIIWQENQGWHGCLKWTVEGMTDFVGPFASRRNVIAAVRIRFSLAGADPKIILPAEQ